MYQFCCGVFQRRCLRRESVKLIVFTESLDELGGI